MTLLLAAARLISTLPVDDLIKAHNKISKYVDIFFFSETRQQFESYDHANKEEEIKVG